MFIMSRWWKNSAVENYYIAGKNLSISQYTILYGTVEDDVKIVLLSYTIQYQGRNLQKQYSKWISFYDIDLKK